MPRDAKWGGLAFHHADQSEKNSDPIVSPKDSSAALSAIRSVPVTRDVTFWQSALPPVFA